MKIEVKGTTSPSCDAIFMTSNEVALHRLEAGKTALILVPGIKLAGPASDPVASGGTCEAIMAWDISQWIAEPMSYRVSRQKV